MTGADQRFEVAIITWNRREELCRTLDRLRRCPEGPRVVVVDNGSSDGTAEAVAHHHPDVALIRAGRNLGAAGRNLAVAGIAAPYVAFCDDDTWWEPGSLSRAADALDHHPRLAVVTGQIIVEPTGRADPVCADMADSALPDVPGVIGRPLLSFLAGASMVRRAAFTAAGGFNEHFFFGGEEELLGIDLVSAGWAMTYLDDVVVHHHASTLRDAHEGRRRGIRNTLWFTWMRRPGRSALRRTARQIRRLPCDAVTLAGLLDAARGLPWVWRHRRVVPAGVERDLRLLEDGQLNSKARRYVS